MPAKERVGVIVVHGIGEQRRFQFLDGQARYLIGALRLLEGAETVCKVSVDINPSVGGAFAAEHDSWAGGPEPSVTIVVHHHLASEDIETRLDVHEVWYADVDEPYSLAKQFRFWLWGLAVWLFPARDRSDLPTKGEVAPPQIPGFIRFGPRLWARARLFGVGVVFALIGASVGTLTFVASRVFNWQPPKILRLITNYVSGVKLLNQSRRFGPGLIWQREDFLDTVDEPPRISVRRRMIRAIADVACREDAAGRRYARWYILAHSLGTVVAFNGLMETAYAWPGYLDEQRWRRLRHCGLAGEARSDWPVPEGDTFPRRPGWCGGREIAYRAKIFERFSGFLTFGSPLEKFAAIWPVLVPISRVPTFRNEVRWFNVFDPLDPVSGVLQAFDKQSKRACPHPVNIGYRTFPVLLYGHLRYFTKGGGTQSLAVATVRWLLTGHAAEMEKVASGARGFEEHSTMRRCRRAGAYAWWFAIIIMLAFAVAWVLPLTVKAAVGAIKALGHAWNGLGKAR